MVDGVSYWYRALKGAFYIDSLVSDAEREREREANLICNVAIALISMKHMIKRWLNVRAIRGTFDKNNWNLRQTPDCYVFVYFMIISVSAVYVYVNWRHAHKTEDIICHRITLHIFINNQNHIHNHRHTQLSYIMTKEPLIRISQQICFFFI